MGGTNNVWRHADLAPEIADDIADEILDFYAKAVSQAESSQMDQLGYVPMILINSVPPFGKVKVHSANRYRAINVVNQRVQDWITNLNHPNVVYCDVFAAMADNDGYARSELVVPDGVTFYYQRQSDCR